jgi:alkylation response protein AidB-like acyl-CoA dehydrogenase
LVAESRQEAEHLRRLPAEAYEAMREAGLLDIAVPHRLGGPQLPVSVVSAVIREMAQMDGAFAWNLMICATGSLAADYLTPGAEKEVFPTGHEKMAGSFAPTGQAIPVEGGFQVSGRWSFASGSHNADWLMGGFMVLQDGKSQLNVDGSLDVLLLLMPKGECEIEDTWYTAGMRGTGSHDFNVKDLFVPAERGFRFSQFASGPMEHRGGYRMPFHHMVIPSMAAVSLGIARDAIGSFVEMAAKKTPRGSSSTLATQHTTHLRLGEAEALLRAAQAYWEAITNEIDNHDYSDRNTLEALTASVRLAGAQIVKSSTEVVDIMFDLGGGSAIYETSRLERCFRDAHIVSHHVTMSAANFEMVGQYLLGFGLKARR